VKEECPTSLPSPNVESERVEVQMRERHALNIHMFYARWPGLLLSTMRALDGLGLDVEQEIISCFNGFALDVFREEQAKEGKKLHLRRSKLCFYILQVAILQYSPKNAHGCRICIL